MCVKQKICVNLNVEINVRSLINKYFIGFQLKIVRATYYFL